MEEIRDREQEKLPKSNLIRFILLSTAGAVCSLRLSGREIFRLQL